MKRPKILLFKSHSIVSKVTGVTPPLGLLYIAAALRERLGADVRVIVAMLENDPMNVMVSTLRHFRPDVVGISALTAEAFSRTKLPLPSRRKHRPFRSSWADLMHPAIRNLFCRIPAWMLL